MDTDTRTLAELVERLRALDGIGVNIAEEARAGVEEAARATAAAGAAPDGKSWKPKKDGGRPLAHASEAITAEVSGTTKAVVVLVLRGINVYHHHGTGRLPARPILPTEKTGIPALIANEVDVAARRVIARAMGAR